MHTDVFEFLADQSEAEEENPHVVLRAFGAEGTLVFRARALCVFGEGGDGEAEDNVTFDLSGMGSPIKRAYVEGAALLSESAVDIVELNISCPNVKVGGMAYGVKAEAAGEVVRMVRAACKKPLMVKLSPQAENIPEMCKAVEAAGADAISLTNTFQACAIDLEKRKPVFNNIFAGLSGPAVRPIALRMVWQAVGAVNIPVVGLGGIATGRDALEFIMAGATAVQVGAANFANPRAMETIADEMAQWMDAHGVKTLEEIRGCARNAE